MAMEQNLGYHFKDLKTETMQMEEIPFPTTWDV